MVRLRVHRAPGTPGREKYPPTTRRPPTTGTRHPRCARQRGTLRPPGVYPETTSFGNQSPQHVSVLSVRNPHEYLSPALIAVYCPSGTSVCPAQLSPEQVMVPSVRNPQAWS